jgi:hypothetical protein
MSQVGQDYIRTRALNVEDSTRAVGAETQFDGWEKLRDKLRSLTESSCVQLLDGLPERKPSASALYSCEVVLPSDPTGAMTRIESQCRAEIEEMLRTYGFAVGSDRVVIDVTYVPDQFSVVVYPALLT